MPHIIGSAARLKLIMQKVFFPVIEVEEGGKFWEGKWEEGRELCCICCASHSVFFSAAFLAFIHCLGREFAV